VLDSAALDAPSPAAAPGVSNGSVQVRAESGLVMSDRLSSDLASLRIVRAPRPQAARVRWWGFAIAVAAGALYVAYRAGWPLIEARLRTQEVLFTEVAVVSPAQAQVQLTSTGYVVPQLQALVSSKLVGRVERARVREGDEVKMGQVIFELDASDQRAAVFSAQARVAAARARAVTARAQLAEIVKQRARERKLAETGALAQATVDDLDAKARSVEAQVQAADADVAAQQAEVVVLATNLGNATIRAPIDGIVVTKPLAAGEVVTPGAPMAKIADFSSIVVESDVPEGRLRTVHRGDPAEVVLDAYPDKRWRAEVVEISPQLNRAKGTATVKVRLLDRDRTVMPEMAARVSLLAAPLDQARLNDPLKTIVPAAALVDRSGTKVVFVVDSGAVRMVPVMVGEAWGGGFALVSGPPPGTKLVSSPPPTLADGQPVKERSQ
jgi:RND family efflux transporter MFP subunit